MPVANTRKRSENSSGVIQPKEYQMYNINTTNKYNIKMLFSIEINLIYYRYYYQTTIKINNFNNYYCFH